MKIPFYTLLGPLIEKNKHPLITICSHPLLSFSQFHVAILGIAGMILSVFDTWRIIRCGHILPDYLHKEGLKKGKIISAEAERDCKLISLVLSTEYYFFLLVGLATNNPVFYMPFLVLNALIILSEPAIFLTEMAIGGFNLKKRTLVNLIIIYNWLNVACSFAKSLSHCDL
ncbi:unnamed protein product [Ceutorhynchus assimilis]|uniref:Uncharacterized protein n=1 Tax=Ceutorhynchus assimilis TaxID=467358 RepID=A0A9N9MZM0_9CUCU|nr:unnamed protein product [Ceutorhynchus assimilis]